MDGERARDNMVWADVLQMLLQAPDAHVRAAIWTGNLPPLAVQLMRLKESGLPILIGSMGSPVRDQ